MNTTLQPTPKSLPITSLKPHPHNARTHNKRQIRKIADSIRAFGFIGHVLIDKDHQIIAGHGRVEAAKLLKFDDVPTLCVGHLTPEQLRAYMIADNRLAELAGWDEGLLAIEFQHFLQMDLDFDVSITGFDAPHIDMLIMKQQHDDADEEPPLEIDDAVPIVSRRGDLWVLGNHRVYCGDALEEQSYQHLMQGAYADLIFTDPPYNVPIVGHVSGLGKHTHAEFAMASGEMNDTQFVDFLNGVFQRMTQHARDGSIHFCCMDWRGADKVSRAAQHIYSELKNICVWNKDKGGMGSLYRSKHEFIFVYKQGDAPHVNNVELGRHGRNRTNVWNYPSANSLMHRDGGMLAQHPTPKPVAMVADAIRDCSNQHNIVLDPFGGSGSTLIAAEVTKRHARVMEIEPLYVDLMIRRWQRKTLQTTTLAATGQSFEQVAAERVVSAGKAVAYA